MTSNIIWLSYKQERYVARVEKAKRIFYWSGKKETWDYNDCVFSIVGTDDDFFRIIARRTKFFDSTYMNGQIKVNLMLGFKVKKAHRPIEEEYLEPPPHNEEGKKYGKKRKRWAIHLDTILENEDPAERPITDCCIWQWADDQNIEESQIFYLYKKISDNQNNSPKQKNIFQVETKSHNNIMPVLYQPRIDAWKNFVREIHAYKKNDKEIEVTIIFNDEQLRKHSFFDAIYRLFRSYRYNRTKDIESFKIKLDEMPREYTFENIYSGRYTLYHDSIHEDKPDKNGNVPPHKIKYYFANMNHPIIFSNTANHAFAEHDNNHYLWKWEYVAWEEMAPIVYGAKSRDEIDSEFK